MFTVRVKAGSPARGSLWWYRWEIMLAKHRRKLRWKEEDSLGLYFEEELTELSNWLEEVKKEKIIKDWLLVYQLVGW